MQRPEEAADVAAVDLTGTTAVVTGATSGIGRQTALALARLGGTVLLHGRDQSRGRAVLRQVRRWGDGGFYRADFTSLAAVRGLAASIRERIDRLDVLVHNAGAYFSEGALTADGIERTMAVNHLAPFVLTDRLRPLLAGDARVVTVSSEAHRRAGLDPDRLTTVDEYDGFAAYGRSKLANILFTRELARRLDGPTANALHPGFIPGSALWRESSIPVRALMGVLGRLPSPAVRLFAETPTSGARTPVYLAASPEVSDVTGRYFIDCEPATPSATARDDGLARALWERSAALADTDTDDAVDQTERT